ncbi:hypothetical protein QR685DRAFT_437942, partial [Neurospora intermedia]
YVHLNAPDGRGEISVAKEKVAFSLYYLNRALLGAKFSYLGLLRPIKTGISFAFQPLINRYAAPSLLAALEWAYRPRPLVWIFYITFGPTTTAGQALKAWAS